MDDWDPEIQVEQLIARCNGKIEFYKEIYELIGVEFRYSAPTPEELELYIVKLAEKYKNKQYTGEIK